MANDEKIVKDNPIVKDDTNSIVPNNSNNVSVGKGKVTGYILSAPSGTTLPTDASSTLPEAFVNLGYIGEDGITNAKETESTGFKDMNGDTVLTTIQSKKETFKFKLIETRAEALKEIYGQSNVTVTSATSTEGEKITFKSTSDELPSRVYVIELVLSGGHKMRKVIPSGKVTELGEEVYSSGELIGYEATVTASPGTDGATVISYLEKAL